MTLSLDIVRKFALRDSPDGSVGLRRIIVDAIDRSSFTIEFIHEPNPHARPDELRKGENFGIILKPGEAAKRLFGFDREILLWCSTYNNFQARDTAAMQEFRRKHKDRVSSHASILVSQYDKTDRSITEEKSDHSIVHFSIAELKNHGLHEMLARNLYTRDLFDVSGATVASGDFFGRREVVDRIVGEVTAGSSQIGIFGLRKVGKTSLLNRISSKLQHSDKIITARLDLQWTVSINESPEYTLWALGESIYASHRGVRRVNGFILFGKFDTFSAISPSEIVWEMFDHDYRLLVQSLNKKICVLIDEIERMYESSERRGFVRFWRLLRGLDQQIPGKLRIVIGGTSPECAQAGKIGFDDNPLFNYLKLEYLGPLDAVDAKRMMIDIGKLMGLNFCNSGLEWVLEQCGGHPALLRTLGSMVHNSRDVRTEPIDIDRALLERREAELSKRVSPVIDQMIAALVDQHETEYELLMLLAEGKIHNFNEYSEVYPSEAQRLISYGLIITKPYPGIYIRQLHSTLLRKIELRSVDWNHSETLTPGAKIGSWTVVDVLAAGGYADVYRVESADGKNLAAAKIIRSGNLDALQREVDVLSEISYPGIVKILETLRTENDRPCLIMDLISGDPASKYCSPSKAPATSTWFSWVKELLNSLVKLHPQEKRARDLEKTDPMTPAVYAEWTKAKHGYIHRDIKPENIMISEDGNPILIDFNISVRAGTPVNTVSATSGYLYRMDVAWSATTDIYALGITMLELAAGNRLVNSSVDELMDQVDFRHPPEIRKIINLMIDSPNSKNSALEIRKKLSNFQPTFR